MLEELVPGQQIQKAARRNALRAAFYNWAPDGGPGLVGNFLALQIIVHLVQHFLYVAGFDGIGVAAFELTEVEARVQLVEPGDDGTGRSVGRFQSERHIRITGGRFIGIAVPVHPHKHLV